jgi:hypothetical protein
MAIVTSLRIGSDRVRLYGVGLFLIGMSQIRFVRSVGRFWDWVDFYIAGATVGTAALLDPIQRAAWGAAHQVSVTAFMYMPGFAWFLWPAAHVPLSWGFAANAVVMVACCAFAAPLAARAYGISRSLALLIILAWAPVTAAIVTGQNSPLGMLLSLLVVLGFAAERPALTGLAAGALMYKPTYALPVILLLLLRKEWKSLAIVVVCGVVWYALSIAATGGEWLWPLTYLRSLTGYAGPDFVGNRFKSISVPGVFMLLGTSKTVAYALGAVLLVAGLVVMTRVPLVQAASLAPLIGLAASPHAWPYDAAVALPALFWVVSTVEEPWRTRIIVAAYAIAPTWLASNVLHFDLLSIVVIGGAVWYVVAHLQRRPALGMAIEAYSGKT